MESEKVVGLWPHSPISRKILKSEDRSRQSCLTMPITGDRFWLDERWFPRPENEHHSRHLSKGRQERVFFHTTYWMNRKSRPFSTLFQNRFSLCLRIVQAPWIRLKFPSPLNHQLICILRVPSPIQLHLVLSTVNIICPGIACVTNAVTTRTSRDISSYLWHS